MLIVRFRAYLGKYKELFKMLVLATVPVHETSLANQHFYSTLLSRGEGYVKRVSRYSLYVCENAENYGWSLS